MCYKEMSTLRIWSLNLNAKLSFDWLWEAGYIVYLLILSSLVYKMVGDEGIVKKLNTCENTS